MSEHCGVSQSVAFGVLPRSPDVVSRVIVGVSPRVIVGVSPSHMASFFCAYCCFDYVKMVDMAESAGIVSASWSPSGIE